MNFLSKHLPHVNRGMGTELLHALDPLATLANNDGNAVNRVFRRLNSRACSGQRFLKGSTRTFHNQIQKSMDKSLDKYNKESVKKTMLKQEEIFKEQVQELHRLYRVQKVIMAELQSKKTKLRSSGNAAPPATSVGPTCFDTDGRTAYWSAGTCSTPRDMTFGDSPFGNSHCPATQMNFNGNFDELYNVRPNTSSHEQSSCSKDSFRLQWGIDLERPAREEISTDASTIEDQAPVPQVPMKNKTSLDGLQGPCFFADGENDVELTLGVGCSKNERKNKHRPRSNAALGCSNSIPDETRQVVPSTSVGSVGEEECSNTDGTSFDQGSFQRPHWLFQALNLNRT